MKKYKGGKPEKRIFVYDSNFKYIKFFENQTECQEYYGLTKGNLFFNNTYREMGDGNFITPIRLGRKGLIREVFIRNSKFTKKLSTDLPIDIFNCLGEKVGEFRSFRELLEVTDMNSGSLRHNYRADIEGKTKLTLRELNFKLKK